MRLSRALQDKLMDVRLRDKLIAEGKVKKDEVENFLKSLPDETNNLKHSAIDAVRPNIKREETQY